VTRRKKFIPLIVGDDGQKILAAEPVAMALLEVQGSVSAASELLGVDSMRLRAYVRAKRELSAIVDEVMEQAVDKSIGVLLEGLADEGSFQNRFYSAKVVLNSEKGRARGFGKQEGVPSSVRASVGSNMVEVKWLEPPTIDGETV
jgi:pyocin large subunit-like protein